MIKLTLTSEVLKDEVDKRIKELYKDIEKSKKDEEGNSAEWYESMGLRVPKHLEEDSKEAINLEITKLEDDDNSYTQLESITFIKVDSIDIIVDKIKDVNTTIFSGNKSFSVIESAEEVYALIEQKLNKQ